MLDPGIVTALTGAATTGLGVLGATAAARFRSSTAKARHSAEEAREIAHRNQESITLMKDSYAETFKNLRERNAELEAENDELRKGLHP